MLSRKDKEIVVRTFLRFNFIMSAVFSINILLSDGFYIVNKFYQKVFRYLIDDSVLN